MMMRRVSERMRAIDPGSARARSALRSLLALVIGGGAGVGFLTLMGMPTRPGIVGGMIAMMAVMMVQGETPREQLAQIGRLALAALLSALLAAALSGWPAASYAGFLCIIAGAAWVQRWGQKGVGIGIVAFMAHFNVLFMKIGLADLPWLVSSLVIGFLGLVLVTFVLVPDNARVRVRRIVPGFRARILRLVEVVREVAAMDSVDRGGRRLLDATGAVQETALLIDTMLENPAARAGVGDPLRLRDHVFAAEVLADHLAAMVTVAFRADDRPARERLARRLENALPELENAAEAPATIADLLPAHVGSSVDHLDDLLGRLERALASVASAARPPGGSQGAVQPEWPMTADTGTMVDDDRTVSSVDGAEGESRLAPTTRKMVQVTIAGALSIVVGMWFSESYWYYAVIGASFTLLTTPTRGASLRKAFDRTLGTAIGVGGGMALAALLSGSTGIEVAIMVALAFIAFWSYQASYMMVVVLFTTIIALMYDMMGVHTLQLLLVRLLETFIGAGFGALAAFLVLPVSTRRSLDEHVVRSLAALEGVLDSLDPGAGQSVVHDLVHLKLRELNQAFSAFRSAGKPLATGLPIRSARDAQRELLLMSALRYRARDLVSAVTGADGLIHPVDAAALPALDVVRRRIEWIRRRIDRTDAPGVFIAATELDDGNLVSAPGRTGEALRTLYQRLDSFAESRALAREVGGIKDEG